MDELASEIDPTLCPLCGQPNACALEIERSTGVKQAPCWCTRFRFNANLLKRIPPQAQGLACLCRHCANPEDLA